MHLHWVPRHLFLMHAAGQTPTYWPAVTWCERPGGAAGGKPPSRCIAAKCRPDCSLGGRENLVRLSWSPHWKPHINANSQAAPARTARLWVLEEVCHDAQNEPVFDSSSETAELADAPPNIRCRIFSPACQNHAWWPPKDWKTTKLPHGWTPAATSYELKS